MAHRLALAVLASGLAAFAFAGVSHADEAVKKLVKDEIKAYMDKKKEEDTKNKVFKASWKDGLAFETPDKAFTMKIGGRVHLDTAFVDDDDLDTLTPAQDIDDQTFFRRLRLYVSGDIDKHVDYKIQLDFASVNNPIVRDAWITLKNLKDCLGCWVPDVRAGQQYEPIGLETISSSNNNALIERSLTTALHPERQIGLNFLDSFWNERATTQLGIFSTDGADDGEGLAVWDSEEGDGGYAITGRFTLVPWAKDTCRFLHVGASASYRTTDEVRFRARPGLGYGPRLVDTGTLGNLDEDNLWIWNGELALVWNSFHLASEYTVVDISDEAREDPSFNAWYVQAGWFLTGESKAYSFKTGTWGNTKPCCNFLSNDCCCWGAFELVARYDTLDLNDGTIEGGQMTNIAAGLNWYLNPNTRIMFNVIFSTTEDKTTGDDIPDADVTSFVMRWDVHF